MDIGEFTVLIAGTSSKDEGAKCDPPLSPPPPKQGSLCACWREGWGVVCSSPTLTENSKNESVSEMSVQGKFDKVASDPKSSCGLYQRHENPPTDGSIKNSQWDAGDELLSARV